MKSITKMRENCLQQFDEHWKCLENSNHVRTLDRHPNHNVYLLLTFLTGVLSLPQTGKIT